MITYNPEKPLISIHIPKTGGTSFRRNLEAWFGRQLYFHYLDEDSGRKPTVVRLRGRFRRGFRRNICIHGHFNRYVGVGIDAYYPEVDQFIAWVRDPVDLQLSLFAHHTRIRGSARYNRDGVLHETRDIDEFLEWSTSPYFKQFPRPVTGENMFQQVEDMFIHVGALEAPERSLQIMAEKLGRRVSEMYHVNVSPRSQVPSESSIRRFKEKSALEYKLHAFALAANQ